MLNRRRFLQGKLALALFGAWAPRAAKGAASRRDFFAELGVKEFINAAEPFTTLTGAMMPQEVREAWTYGAGRYVRLEELHDAVGKRIAGLLGAEAAMVTAGAASALTLGTAACITGADAEKIRRLPDIAGLKNEVIIQKSHRYGYDHAVRNCGIRYVEVQTRRELESAIGERTAMLHFFNTNEPAGEIKLAEFAEIARKHRVPAFNDIAADVPPVENLWKSLKLGYDLVAVSGGKGLCGPQSSGLLYGRADLIHAARLNGPPHSDAIGRGMKVNKEELLGMMVALESYIKRNAEADWREWEKRVEVIRASVAGLKGVQTEMFVPPIHYRVPHVRIRWEESAVPLAVRDAIRRLREGEPSIEVRPNTDQGLEMSVWMLQPGEVRVVARRLRQVLTGA